MFHVSPSLQNQIKKRVSSLERQLAEERLKVATAQKKLQLVATEQQSISLSDDSKLHLREKELLQEEVRKQQVYKILSRSRTSILGHVVAVHDKRRLDTTNGGTNRLNC